jgi:hypothetical protein
MCIDVVARMNSVISVSRNGSAAIVLFSLKNSSWNVRHKEVSLLFLSMSALMGIGSSISPVIAATTVEISCLTTSSNVQDVWSVTADGALSTEDSHLLEGKAEVPLSLFILEVLIFFVFTVQLFPLFLYAFFFAQFALLRFNSLFKEGCFCHLWVHGRHGLAR